MPPRAWLLCQYCNAHFSERSVTAECLAYVSGLAPNLYLHNTTIYVGHNRGHIPAPFANNTANCSSCKYFRYLYLQQQADNPDNCSPDPLGSDDEPETDD